MHFTPDFWCRAASCCYALFPRLRRKLIAKNQSIWKRIRLRWTIPKQTSIYQGKVILTQGTLVIRGDKLVVKQSAEGFEHGTVYGTPATFKQKREGYDEYIEGFADRIEYNAKSDKAELFTHARMKRNQDEVQGNYISYDAKTEFFQVLGGDKEKGGAGGRVRAVIQPKTKPAASGYKSGTNPCHSAANRKYCQWRQNNLCVLYFVPIYFEQKQIKKRD